MPTDYRLPLDNTQDKVRVFQSQANLLLQPPGFPGQLMCAADGTIGVANGYAAGNVALLGPVLNFAGQISTGITAFSGGGQQVGSPVAKQVTVVSTAAAGADSLTLPAATGTGLVFYIANNAASNSISIYGNTGDKINNGSANAAVTCAAGKARLFIDVATNNYQSLLGA